MHPAPEIPHGAAKPLWGCFGHWALGTSLLRIVVGRRLDFCCRMSWGRQVVHPSRLSAPRSSGKAESGAGTEICLS